MERALLLHGTKIPDSSVAADAPAATRRPKGGEGEAEGAGGRAMRVFRVSASKSRAGAVAAASGAVDGAGGKIHSQKGHGAGVGWQARTRRRLLKKEIGKAAQRGSKPGAKALKGGKGKGKGKGGKGGKGHPWGKGGGPGGVSGRGRGIVKAKAAGNVSRRDRAEMRGRGRGRG